MPLIDPLAAVARASELTAAGDWTAARTAWRAVVEDNPVHGTHWCLLGYVCAEGGRYAEALPAYQQALRLGAVGFEPVPTDAGELHLRIATCHAALAQPGPALAVLREALAAGLRDPGRLATDPTFALLRDDPEFTELLRPWHPADQPGDGTARDGAAGDGAGGRRDQGRRDEGWRGDLALLLLEIRRRSPNALRVAGRLDELGEALHRDIPTLADEQIVLGFWRLLRLLDDGHARLRAERAYPAWHVSLPLWFHQFTEGMFVTEADAHYGHLLGGELLTVDDRPIETVLAALDPVLTRDNDQWAVTCQPFWLRRTHYLHALGVLDRPDRARLRVRTLDAAEVEVTVPAQEVPLEALPHTPAPPDALRLPAAVTAVHLSRRERPYWFVEYPADALVYLQYNSIQDDPEQPWEAFLAQLFERVDAGDGQRLVVDLRYNGGGNTFLAVSLLHAIARRPAINRRGGLFVLIGRVTFSAAQNLATMLQLYTEAIFVGEPTGSSPNFVGETVPFTLPYSRISANISDLVWQTSWPMDRRVAIAPDLYAPPTFADHLAGRDAALDRIRALPR